MALRMNSERCRDRPGATSTIFRLTSLRLAVMPASFFGLVSARSCTGQNEEGFVFFGRSATSLRVQPGYALRIVPASFCSADARGEPFRHTKPIVRCGDGLANPRTFSSARFFSSQRRGLAAMSLPLRMPPSARASKGWSRETRPPWPSPASKTPAPVRGSSGLRQATAR